MISLLRGMCLVFLLLRVVAPSQMALPDLQLFCFTTEPCIPCEEFKHHVLEDVHRGKWLRARYAVLVLRHADNKQLCEGLGVKQFPSLLLCHSGRIAKIEVTRDWDGLLNQMRRTEEALRQDERSVSQED